MKQFVRSRCAKDPYASYGLRIDLSCKNVNGSDVIIVLHARTTAGTISKVTISNPSFS